MRVKLLSLLFLCLIANITYAQNARAILDRASETYVKAGSVTAKFTLNTKEVNAKQVYSQDGTAYMKGNKFKIEIPDAITWFDGKTQWVYIKGTEEVNISNPTGAELQAISPSLLFSIYKQGYNLIYNGEKTINGKKVDEVEMTAQNKKNDLKKIIVQINKNTNTFSKIVLYDTNGMENSLIINNYQSNSSLSDSTFTFNKNSFPNAEVVDLR